MNSDEDRVENSKMNGLVKLNKNNYKTWAFNMELELEDRDLWQVIIDEEKFNEAEEKTKRKTFKIIARAITEEIQSDILNFNCPRKLWQYLSSRFQPNTRLRRLQASKSLFSAKMECEEDMDMYINRILSLAADVVKSGSVKVDEEQVCNVIINGLTEEYDTTVAMICTFNDADYKISKIESLLVGEYRRKKLKQEEGEKGAREKALWGHAKRGMPTRDFRKCFKCGRPGHLAKFCQQPVYKVSGATFISHIHGNINSGGWFIDSGASAHFTNCKSDFICYKSMQEEMYVAVASETKYKIHGYGNIIIQQKPSGWRVELAQVFYVPDFRIKLLSVAELERLGWKITMYGGLCTLADGKSDNKLVAERNHENMYELNETNAASTHKQCYTTKIENQDQWKWHLRFGHVSGRSIVDLYKNNMVRGLDDHVLQNFKANEVCDACQYGKSTRKSFPKISRMLSTEILEIIHSDVCGPMPVSSKSGSRYFVTFIDDFSRRARIYFIKTKNEVFSCFKHFIITSEKQTGKVLKILRSDNGGEYVNNEFNQYLRNIGVVHQLTNVYSPQENGVAERYNRTLLDLARSMLNGAGMPNSFWAEAVNCANYIRNRCPIQGRKCVPEELWTGRKPSVAHLKPFGCHAFVHVPKQKRSKLDKRAVKCLMLGYSSHSKGYRLWNLTDNNITVSRDVTFDESKFGFNDERKNNNVEEIIYMDDTEVRDRKNNNNNNVNLRGNEIIETGREMNEGKRNLRDRLKLKRPDYYAATSQTILADEPVNYKEAMKRIDAEKWLEATNEEYSALIGMGVWDLEELPKGRKAIGCKWVFKIKKNADGSVERYKARLVAQGFTQEENKDYFETYSPVANLTTIRLMLTLAVHNNWEIHQMDVKTAYLNGDLKEEIYMKQPEGYIMPGSENKVCKLKKSLYGLKQSGRAWNEKLDMEFKKCGMRRSKADGCVYYRTVGKGLDIIVVYVDDLLIISPNEQTLKELKRLIRSCFEVKDLGKVNYLLGIRIQRFEDGSISMDQNQFIRNMLKEFNMENSKPVSTPLNPGQDLSKQQCPKTEEERMEMINVPFRQLIGKLLYLALATRPDLAYAVSKLGQYSSNPGKEHWVAAKRLLRYLQGTKDFKLSINPKNEEMSCWSDADWAGNKEDRRSTSGFCIRFGGSPIAWKCSKQTCVSLSTMEAEFVAVALCAREVIWIRMLLSELTGKCKTFNIFCDNQAAINFVRNHVISSRSKHIDIRNHFVRDLMSQQVIDINYISTNENAADLLTKPLTKDKVINFRKHLGIIT